MLFSFRSFIYKRKLRDNIIKFIDDVWTIIGIIILIVLFIVATPFIVLMDWMSGER